VSGEKTKRAAVTAALEEYIARRAQATISDSRSTFQWDDDFDHKEARRARDERLGLVE